MRTTYRLMGDDGGRDAEKAMTELAITILIGMFRLMNHPMVLFSDRPRISIMSARFSVEKC